LHDRTDETTQHGQGDTGGGHRTHFDDDSSNPVNSREEERGRSRVRGGEGRHRLAVVDYREAISG